jgi:hypothetical protein
MQSAFNNKNKPGQLKQLHLSKMLHADLTVRLNKAARFLIDYTKTFT